MWTLFVQRFDGEIVEFEIDPNSTFGEFRRMVADKININVNNLLLIGGEEYGKSYNSKIIKEIGGITDGTTLFSVYQIGYGGDYWTLYVQRVDNNELLEFKINPNSTFGEFRRMVADKININVNDLSLVGCEEYIYKYDLKKISEISGIHDDCTLLALYNLRGGST